MRAHEFSDALTFNLAVGSHKTKVLAIKIEVKKLRPVPLGCFMLVHGYISSMVQFHLSHKKTKQH